MMTRAALFAALAIVLPILFHMVGLGAMFLPMFLPVMFGSAILTWKYAMLVAVIAPIVSNLMTGMPPVAPPVLPVMLVELVTVALSLSILHTHKQYSIWIALPVAILLDRLVLWSMVSLIAPLFGFDHPFFSASLVVSGIPGIVLQLALIPLLLKSLHRSFPYLLNYRGETDSNG